MAKFNECYQVLGIDPGATAEEVEEAYGDLAKVWNPERFPSDDHTRQMAQKKMAEIKAARDAVLGFIRSRGNAGRQGVIDWNASPLIRACDNPRCTGTIDSNGVCDVCGKHSGPNIRRYVVFCSACGARNLISSQKDYDRGICAVCRVPLSAPVRLEQKSSRKTAYSILLVIIFTLTWFLFSSGKPQAPDSNPKLKPLNTLDSQPSIGVSPGKTMEVDQVTPSRHSTEGSGEVRQEPTPAEKDSYQEKVPVGEAREVPAGDNGRQKPTEDAGRISGDAIEETGPITVRPFLQDESKIENYDRLIDEVAKKKAARPQVETDVLSDLPSGKLTR